MKEYRCVVFSDIHFGHLSTHEDFCCPEIRNESFIEGSKSMINSLIERLSEFDHIDDIVICGDLTSYATPLEFSELSKKFDYIFTSLDNYNGQAIFSLGNHDVNWDLHRLTESPIYSDFDIRFFKEKSKRIHDSFNLTLPSCKEGPFPNTGIIETEKSVVIVLNSATESSPSQEVKNGKLGNVQLEWLEKQFPLDNEKWQIIVMHHHPYKYNYPIYCRDISNIEDGDRLEEIISRNGIDIVIHGHRHHPLFFTETKNLWKRPVNFLCSGSLSVNSSNRLGGKIDNTFHVVELKERHETTNAAVGTLHNYSYSLHSGWEKTEYSEYCKLDGTMYFGNISSETERRNSLKNLINSLPFNGNPFCVLPEFENLPYLLKCNPIKMVNKDLKLVADELGYKIAGSYPYECTCIVRN